MEAGGSKIPGTVANGYFSYADLNERDYQALAQAAASGRMKVQRGL